MGLENAMRLLMAGALMMAASCAQAQDSSSEPAESPDLKSADAAALSRCLESAQAEETPFLDCQGVISDPCMDPPEGQTTAGMVSCFQRETEVWDGYLNVWYKDARQSLPGDAPEKLQDVQRMWIDYRKARCALSYDIYAGGTLAGVVAGQCFLDETARRATELAALMFNGDGDVSVAAP